MKHILRPLVLLCVLLAGSQFTAAQTVVSTEMEGQQVSLRTGDLIQIRFQETVPVGTEGALYLFFQKEFLGIPMEGWLETARVRVLSLPGKNGQSVKILEEKSDITLNGEKQELFRNGDRVKLEWDSQPPATDSLAPAPSEPND